MNKLVTSFMVVSLLVPQLVMATDYSSWLGKYGGVWDDTYDNCGDTNQDGVLYIQLKKISQTGKIREATVRFDDENKIRSTSGKVFKRNGVNRIRLNYGSDGATYTIKAKLTSQRVMKGRYDHVYSGCEWGGSLNLPHL